MTDITYEFFTNKIYTYPKLNEFENIISRVSWIIVFRQNGQESVAGGETLLDITNISRFLDVSKVSGKDVENWVFNTEGPDLIPKLLEYHSKNLEKLNFEAQLVEWDHPLVDENRWKEV